MKIALNILIVMLFGMTFDLFPQEPMHVFVFVDYQITLQQLVWVLSARLTLAYFIWEASNNRTGIENDALKCFFWLTVLDSFDYILTANTPYLGEWISFNTISIFVFVVYIGSRYNTWKYLLRA